jgi:hypothetical protein
MLVVSLLLRTPSVRWNESLYGVSETSLNLSKFRICNYCLLKIAIEWENAEWKSISLDMLFFKLQLLLFLKLEEILIKS